MLAVFAVDIAIGKDADALPALLTTSDAVTDAAAKVLASGEFKAQWERRCCCMLRMD